MNLNPDGRGDVPERGLEFASFACIKIDCHRKIAAFVRHARER
jgi:hypothetical protein